MKDIIFENVSKAYKIPENQDISFRKSIYNLFKKRDQKDTFWALKDVNFELERGESLSLIGANGAGKSTLLKLISRITSPTQGKIVINAKILSLLEVGVGFHSELTGRENIYLNASIFGYKRVEIRKKILEIVEFSGIGKFIDTPIKKYSSGMRARLGFSIVTHVRSDLLILDEVFAVGDKEFQEKSEKVIKNKKKEGCSFIFVSHSPTQALEICEKGIWLHKGQIILQDSVQECLNAYQDFVNKKIKKENQFKSKILKETKLFKQGKEEMIFKQKDSFEFSLKYESESNIDFIIVHVCNNINDNKLFAFHTKYMKEIFSLPKKGTFTFSYFLNHLFYGEYYFNVQFWSKDELLEEVFPLSHFHLQEEGIVLIPKHVSGSNSPFLMDAINPYISE